MENILFKTWKNYIVANWIPDIAFWFLDKNIFPSPSKYLSQYVIPGLILLKSNFLPKFLFFFKGYMDIFSFS